MTDPELPRVTVVIPTRDRPGLLERAVAAVLAQDYAGEIECLVLFDHVDIRSLDVPVPVSAGRTLRCAGNTHRPGLPGGRNTGFEQATGELVAFCDDDDVWSPAKLRKQVDLLRARPDAAAVSCGIRLQGAGRPRERGAGRTEARLADFLADRVMAVHSSTMLVPLATYAAAGPVDEDIPGGYGEDYEWLLRVAAHGPIVIVPDVLVTVDWHGGSFFFGKWATIVQATRYLLERHPELRGSRPGMARLHGQIAFALASGHRRREALRELAVVARFNPLEKRLPVTLAVASGLVSGERVLALAQRWGRGV